MRSSKSALSVLRLIRPILVVGSAAFVTCAAQAGTFHLLAASDSNCGAIPITGGKQYTEGYPTNGVVPDSWSALYRWQGRMSPAGSYADWRYSDFSPINWDLGLYTGLTVPNYIYGTTTQKGRTAQQHPGYDPAGHAMPGIQAYCGKVGMLLNTWWTPHLPVVGGTPNNMFGHSWSPNNQPHAFKHGTSNAELVLEANVAMTGWAPHQVTSDPYAGAYLAFFVYLRDTTTNLPAFGVLAALHGTGDQSSYLSYGIGPTLDYCNSATDCGGWFVSAPIPSVSGESPPQNPTGSKWITVRNNVAGAFPSTDSQVYPTPFFNPGNLPEEKYFRIHITRENLANIVAKFNDVSMVPCPTPYCPRGYSTDPDNYKVEYAGVIMELLYGPQWAIDTGYSKPYPSFDGFWVENDSSKDQVTAAARMSAVKISRFVP